LAGIRVLDFSWVWAGPHTTKLLCDLGADVVKVESAARVDLLRRGGSAALGVEPGVNTRGSFNQLAQGKRSLQVSLSSPEGLKLVRDLAAQADVVVSNFGTGVMERFGLGAEALLKLNPELVVCAISGYGQTGPYRNYMGYGQAAVPLSGISALTGYRSGQPQEVHIAYGDPVAGVFGALGIAAALVARQRFGGGQFIDVSLWEALMCTGFEGWMAAALPGDATDNPPLAPMGNRDPWHAPHNCYRCSGADAWVSIAVTDAAQWPALCAAMGQPELAQDGRFRTARDRKANEDALDAIVAAWTLGQHRWTVTRRLQEAGVGAFPSLDARDLTDDPHLAARGYFGVTPHPEVGVRPHLGVPWRMTVRPNGARGPAPLLGQHTSEVLREWLGADARRIAEWEAAGILT
jgi:crotonobetainyl-CoA:carnitine CoA-transferase CaiB-like acyl-CoA transferase